jgi:hypothetical protein
MSGTLTKAVAIGAPAAAALRAFLRAHAAAG